MQLDLSTLSTPELRSLLDSARSRGQASQSYRILQEMAARRDAEPKPRKSRKRRPDEPRVISLDLGDPLEPRDEYAHDLSHDDFEVPPMPNAHDSADQGDDPIAGLSLGRAPEPSAPLPQPKSPHQAPPKARSRVLVFATGAILGVAAGWAGAMATSGYAPLNNLALPQMAELSLPKLALPDLGSFVGSSTPAAEPAADIQVAELPPAPTGEAPPPARLEVAVAPADALAVAEDASAQAALPEALPTPPVTPVVAVPPPPPPPEEATNDCDAEPTPADRTICAEPSLQKLQRDLRQAYARALDAHEDRATLRQRQLAWRDARDAVEDPQELAALYEARIRKLNTATAEAKKLAAR